MLGNETFTSGLERPAPAYGQIVYPEPAGHIGDSWLILAAIAALAWILFSSGGKEQ